MYKLNIVSTICKGLIQCLPYVYVFRKCYIVAARLLLLLQLPTTAAIVPGVLMFVKFSISR